MWNFIKTMFFVMGEFVCFFEWLNSKTIKIMWQNLSFMNFHIFCCNVYLMMVTIFFWGGLGEGDRIGKGNGDCSSAWNYYGPDHVTRQSLVG